MINGPHSTTPSTAWDPDFAASSPVYAHLAPYARALRGPYWPTLDQLQMLLAREPVVTTIRGEALSVVRADKTSTMGYEARAYLHGELEVRTPSWHDLFNVLVWRAFPRAKAALNRAHYEALPQARDGRRGARRDALTVFDESGVLVVSDNAELLELLRLHEWHHLLWRRREDVRRSMKFLVFGHALFEKLLCPYVGVTGHGHFVSVSSDVLRLPGDELVKRIDGELAAAIVNGDALATTAALAPLPVLGVPGWWPDNETEAFYGNERYFRPRRAKVVS